MAMEELLPEKIKGYTAMVAVALSSLGIFLFIPLISFFFLYPTAGSRWSAAITVAWIALEVLLVARFDSKGRRKYNEQDDTGEPKNNGPVFIVFQCERVDCCAGPCKNCPTYHDFHTLQKQTASANSKAQALERKGQLTIH